MSTAELKNSLLGIINAINDSATLKDIYSFVSSKQAVGLKKGETESKDSIELEKQQWNELGLSNLSKAYGEDEPDYTNALIIEPNPEYKK